MFHHLPTESRVLAGGLDHHLLTWEGPGDRTLVLLHGWLDLAWSWQPLAERLAGRLRMVAVDFRGHGDSARTPPGSYYHFPDYLRDVHDLLKEVSLGATVLVGHSMGGTVASMYAGAFPARVQGLVVVDGLGPASPVDTPPGRVFKWLGGVEQVTRRAPRSFADLGEAVARMRAINDRIPADLAAFLAARGTRRREDGRLEWKHDPLHTTRSPIAFNREAYYTFLRAIGCPTLIVRATDSFMESIPDLEDRIAAIPWHQEAKIDCGHMVHQERPDELAAAVLAFLEG